MLSLKSADQTDSKTKAPRRPPAKSRSKKGATIADLRRQIRKIESHAVNRPQPDKGLAPNKAKDGADGLWAPISHALGGESLAQVEPALHELVADNYGSQPAVRDFGLALVASFLHQHRRAGDASTVLWCQRKQDDGEFGCLHGPGLIDIGLRPEQLVVITGRRDHDCLWAMEQGLRSGGVAVVIGMVESAPLIASRRLALAAADHRTWCLLMPACHGREPSAASTRWVIKAEASLPDDLNTNGLGRPCWQLALDRSRHGRTGRWIVEWDHETYRFHLATSVADRPIAPRRAEVADLLVLRRAG